ncbi:hypothetical protein RRG08_001251 [Elysia crispata]|uniref:Uncharacterized protein n=1 Tax=Elysia crispata TaxID=231223 RepID=A0AAE1B7S0_9GAST|nr:hypothetical protein RRG08_001251 [Elysia crispata]
MSATSTSAQTEASRIRLTCYVSNIHVSTDRGIKDTFNLLCQQHPPTSMSAQTEASAIHVTCYVRGIHVSTDRGIKDTFNLLCQQHPRQHRQRHQQYM